MTQSAREKLNALIEGLREDAAAHRAIYKDTGNIKDYARMERILDAVDILIEYRARET